MNTVGELTGPAGPSGAAIIQVHPSRRCNLACRHCYSESGPGVRDELPSEVVCRTIRDAATLGYGTLAVSGGEPFLYGGLLDILRCAKECSMHTTVTTNGSLLETNTLALVRDYVDVLAISVDGPPALHNYIRASRQAFGRVCNGLASARAQGIPFGLIHTLTRDSWRHLPWIGRFAESQGARLLQIHPIEGAGRAARLLTSGLPDTDVLARSYLLTLALAAKYRGRMRIQFDVVHREQVLNDPSIIYGSSSDLAPANAPAVVGTLVLETDGIVVPVSYGLSRRYAICDATRDSLLQSWPRYLGDTHPGFAALCRGLWEEIAENQEMGLFNWHELIVERSNSVG